MRAIYKQFPDAKIHRWEDLFAYFLDVKVIPLDTMFKNPNRTFEERKIILNNTNLNLEQKNFLMGVFDIDYLVIQDSDVYLVEEKTKNIDGKRFNEGNYVYMDHGTNTQHQNLRKAYELNIDAGILLRVAKYEQQLVGMDTLLIEQIEPQFEMFRYYPIQTLEYLPKSNLTKLKVDDFIKEARNQARLYL